MTAYNQPCPIQHSNIFSMVCQRCNVKTATICFLSSLALEAQALEADLPHVRIELLVGSGDRRPRSPLGGVGHSVDGVATKARCRWPVLPVPQRALVVKRRPARSDHILSCRRIVRECARAACLSPTALRLGSRPQCALELFRAGILHLLEKFAETRAQIDRATHRTVHQGDPIGGPEVVLDPRAVSCTVPLELK